MRIESNTNFNQHGSILIVITIINQAKEVVRRVAAGNGKQSPEHLLKNASNKILCEKYGANLAHKLDPIDDVRYPPNTISTLQNASHVNLSSAFGSRGFNFTDNLTKNNSLVVSLT